MTIANMIPRRRSVRAYRAECIDNAVLADLLRYMEGLVPLIPGAKVEGRIIPTDHGNFLQKWKTPHFIAIFCTGSGCTTNSVPYCAWIKRSILL